MAYLGRRQLGQEITLPCQCKDSDGAPALPTACPLLTLYDATATPIIAGKSVPILDPASTLGLFSLPLFLGDLFGTGTYSASITWLVGSFHGGELHTFEIMPGGDNSGAVISQFYYPRPHANFVVQQRSGGGTYKGRGPRL